MNADPLTDQTLPLWLQELYILVVYVLVQDNDNIQSRTFTSCNLQLTKDVSRGCISFGHTSTQKFWLLARASISTSPAKTRTAVPSTSDPTLFREGVGESITFNWTRIFLSPSLNGMPLLEPRMCSIRVEFSVSFFSALDQYVCLLWASLLWVFSHFHVLCDFQSHAH